MISAPRERSLIVLCPGEEPRYAYDDEWMFCAGFTRLAWIEFVPQDDGRFTLAVCPFADTAFTQLVSFYTVSPSASVVWEPAPRVERRLCECDQLGFPYPVDHCRMHPGCTGKGGCVSMNWSDPLRPPHSDELQ